MALELMREWSLAVLRISLDLDSRSPSVGIQLIRLVDQQELPVANWSYDLEEFGLDSGNGRLGDREPYVPPRLVSAIGEQMYADPFNGRSSLWIHMVKPHGYLGAVPWEAAIHESGMDFPVIRLPDRLPVSARQGSTFTIAVLACPGDDGPEWATSTLAALVEQMGNRLVEHRIEVHVFADRSAHDMLDHHFDDDLSINVHDPNHAREFFDAYVTRRDDRDSRQSRQAGRTPQRLNEPQESWTAWLRGELGSRTVDAVIALGGAGLDGDAPGLWLSADPASFVGYGEKTSVWLDPGDFGILADQLGARNLAIVANPNEPRTAGRMLADYLGVDRSGVTFFADAALDGGRRLGESLAAILEPENDARLLTDPALFAYLQPELVQPRLADQFPEIEDSGASTRRAALSSIYADADTIPGWIGTAERLIESTQARISKSQLSEIPFDSTQSAYADGMQAALGELEDIIGENAALDWDAE